MLQRQDAAGALVELRAAIPEYEAERRGHRGGLCPAEARSGAVVSIGAPRTRLGCPDRGVTPSDGIADAARWLDHQLGGRPLPPLLVVIGLGQGYLLEVLEHRGFGTRVLALEPDPQLGHSFLARRDWTAWRDAGRLAHLVGPDYAGADDAWRMFPSKPRITFCSSIRSSRATIGTRRLAQRVWPSASCSGRRRTLRRAGGLPHGI